MNLTLYTDYSLRILVVLALRREELVSVQDISETFHISRNHLVKVAGQLGRLGYIETVRGRNGGLRLARPPEEIGIGDVIRAMEPTTDLLGCFDEATDNCRITPACRLKGVLGKAQQAFFDVLDSYNLANIVKNRNALLSLLGEPAPKATTPTGTPTGKPTK